MKNLLILFGLLSIAASCDNQDDPGTIIIDTSNPPAVVGFNYALSTKSFDETYTTLKTALEANENISIVAEVNHQANATSVNLELNPTKVIFFGNPNLGTPLMQANQQAGLDLPQRILVYQDVNEDVYIGYNNTIYLSNRHGLDGVATLEMIATALSNLTINASEGVLVNASLSNVSSMQGITEVVSNRTYDETTAALEMAITNNANLTLVTALDHKANAASVNLDLDPTKVFIFGNPSLGTSLMIGSQTTALDLPQKMLVYENASGEVRIAYNSPSFLVERHNIMGNENTVTTITGALQNLANTAGDIN